jgi:pimeloyl-ACP methyl ester carboxylesterase
VPNLKKLKWIAPPGFCTIIHVSLIFTHTKMLFQHSKFILRTTTLFQNRNYTTQAAVKLSFDKFSIKPSNEPPVLICHGLFGSKQNWSSLAKAMSNRLSRDVYTIVSGIDMLKSLCYK